MAILMWACGGGATSAGTRCIIGVLALHLLLDDSTCPPLAVAQEFINGVDQQTPDNDSGGGNVIYLDRHNMDQCAVQGKVMSKFRLGGNPQLRFDYRCQEAANGLGQTTLQQTDWVDQCGGDWGCLDRLGNMRKYRDGTTCAPNYAMSGFQYGACGAACCPTCHPTCTPAAITLLHCHFCQHYCQRSQISLNMARPTLLLYSSCSCSHSWTCLHYWSCC